MNIFVIHKGSDVDATEKILSSYIDKYFNVHFLVLKSNKKVWKQEAKNLIKKADKVIYFVGNEYSENIGWELNLVRKYKLPLYLVPIKDEYKDKPFILEDDGYQKKAIGKVVPVDEIDSILVDTRDELNKQLFNKDHMDKNLLWEQYKMLLETSENLIERRQKISTTYLTILSIIIPVITSFLVVENKWFNLVSVVLSGLSIILCLCWSGIISSYGKSNHAKFDILELIEKELPTNLFGSEWTALKKYGKNYVSFTERETSIPKIFILIDTFFMIISIVVFILKALNIL